MRREVERIDASVTILQAQKEAVSRELQDCQARISGVCRCGCVYGSPSHVHGRVRFMNETWCTCMLVLGLADDSPVI